MIKVKNIGDLVFATSQIGNVTVAAKEQLRAPFNGVVLHNAMRVRTAGTTGSQVADFKINNTSIYATAGNRPTLTTGTDVTVSGSTIDGTKTFAVGDLLEWSIATAHTTPAVDVSLVAVLRQQPSRGTVSYE